MRRRGSLTLVCGSARMFEVQEIAAEIVVSRIKKWLPRAGDAYEHVIIDCPPSISSVSLAALKAADKILVPMTADQFSLHGLPLLMKALREYKKVLDIRAKVAGVVLSMFPPSRHAIQGPRHRGTCRRSVLCARRRGLRFAASPRGSPRMKPTETPSRRTNRCRSPTNPSTSRSSPSSTRSRTRWGFLEVRRDEPRANRQ
ncbi:hypothetical protein SCE1572_20625 [Sorangium cellulosum So0157-2]|uniref:AAA domain-containing protein n=1 Tax=Sorangium cellulosum So0157-2 TaxID=1254432 RepID=S4XWE3_SORCE|nr:hypothetical protein SCE1572_20625 [Sorangium cellulosum So0157-2]